MLEFNNEKMINIIRSLLNRNKKLYIIVNHKVSKGKIARVCCTIGQKNPHMRFSRVIVVKGSCINTSDLSNYLYFCNTTGSIIQSNFLGNTTKIKISGTHYDLGLTQCNKGDLLGFGLIVKNNETLNLQLY